MTNVIIGNSVTSIGERAFADCSSLTSVYITDIAKWCEIEFANYDSNPLGYAHNLYLNGELVTDLVIPNSVTSIGNGAFFGCNNLTSITIPDGVTSIGDSSFYNCSSLTSVYCKPTIPPLGQKAFDVISNAAKIYVPTASVEAYKSAENWSKYADNIVGYDF